MDALATVPLLPSGDLLFEGLPSRAVVLEELGPVVGDGALLVRQGEQTGVLLVRGGRLLDVCLFGRGERLTGESATAAISALSNARVTAVRFAAHLVELLCPLLLRGESCYSDLQLGWTDWHQLLADIEGRPGTFMVEIHTAGGRGVTVIRDGETVATYADRRPPTASTVPPPASGNAQPPTAGSEPPSAATTISPPATPAQPPATAGVLPPPAAGDGQPSDEAVLERLGNQPAGTVSVRRLVPSPTAADSATIDARMAPSASTPAAAPAAIDARMAPSAAAAPERRPADGAIAVRELLPDLKLIARERLHLSAPRVEVLLDDAADRERPLEAVIADIRQLTIRGVLPTTLNEVADGMLTVAGAGHA